MKRLITLTLLTTMLLPSAFADDNKFNNLKDRARAKSHSSQTKKVEHKKVIAADKKSQPKVEHKKVLAADKKSQPKVEHKKVLVADEKSQPKVEHKKAATEHHENANSPAVSQTARDESWYSAVTNTLLYPFSDNEVDNEPKTIQNHSNKNQGNGLSTGQSPVETITRNGLKTNADNTDSEDSSESDDSWDSADSSNSDDSLDSSDDSTSSIDSSSNDMLEKCQNPIYICTTSSDCTKYDLDFCDMDKGTQYNQGKCTPSACHQIRAQMLSDDDDDDD